MSRKLIIAVTGTPGTGKSFFAKQLSKKMKGFAFIEVNDIVNRYKTFTSRDKWGTKIVDINKLNKALSRELGTHNNVILVGHLVPELRIRPSIAVVTRLSLKRLAKRLESRHYNAEKIRDNLICEATDYCGEQMRKKCKSVYEAEDARTKQMLIRQIPSLLHGAKHNTGKTRIDKFNELIDMANKHKNYGL